MCPVHTEDERDRRPDRKWDFSMIGRNEDGSSGQSAQVRP